jgi:allophanate hydrolase subunit 2
MNSLEILDTGPLSLIQDLGRIGHLRSGVGVSGAADGDLSGLAIGSSATTRAQPVSRSSWVG